MVASILNSDVTGCFHHVTAVMSPLNHCMETGTKYLGIGIFRSFTIEYSAHGNTVF